MFELERQLMRRLRSRDVRIRVPDRETVVFHNVPTHEKLFSKRSTNLLIKRPTDDARFFVFVDEDLAYTGEDPSVSRLFSGVWKREGWQVLRLGQDADADFQSTLEEVLAALGWDGREPVLAVPGRTPGSGGLLTAFGTRLSTRTRDGEVEPTVGREDETEEVTSCVLGWGQKRLALITGESGVGKSNLLGAVARELLRCRDRLELIVVDLVGPMAGALFEADRESRLARLLDEAASDTDVVLALEHLEAYLAGANAVLLVSRFLDRHLPLIATTCPGGVSLFRREPLERHVQAVSLSELTASQTLEVVTAACVRVAAHHRLDIDPSALPVCVQLARDELPGVMPAKALKLLDAAASRVSLAGARVVGPDDVYFTVRHLSAREEG